MKNITKLSLAFVLLASSASVFAESKYSYQSDGVTDPADVTADLDLEIIIPKIMILKIGTTGATVDKISWDSLGMNAAGALISGGTSADNVLYTGAVPPASLDPASADADSTVAVGIWGNIGDIDFSSSDPTFVGGTGTAPDNADITVADGGNLTHPDFGAAAATVSATAGIVSETDTWTYSYDPATIQLL